MLLGNKLKELIFADNIQVSAISRWFLRLSFK